MEVHCVPAHRPPPPSRSILQTFGRSIHATIDSQDHIGAFVREKGISMHFHQTLDIGIRIAFLSLFIATATFTIVSAHAATSAQTDAQYRKHVERCKTSPAVQDRAACLKSAAAGRAEARRSQSDTARPNFEMNALLRCDAQPARDRADCIARVRGEGTAQGSVESGAIVRELITTIPAEQRTGR